MRQSQPLNTDSDRDRPESFQLKGGLFPMSLLELKTPDLTAVAEELRAKVTQSPGFFKRSAIVIGLDQLTDQECSIIDLQALTSICRDLELLPSAIRGGSKALVEQAFELGLAALPKAKSTNKSRHAPSVEVTEPPAPQAETEPETPQQDSTTAQSSSAPQEEKQQELSNAPTTRIVTTPIRSGQQIYARGGDLIILTSVSAGAEVLADGNIHVYGPLRGRALAGVLGDTNARIFCSSQEAELVSVAGHFLVDEVLKNTHWKEPVQIFIKDGRLITSPLN